MSKYNGWQLLQTSQTKEILSELVDAKEDRRALMIISNTGDGKSTAIKLFQSKKPKHTYVITVGHSYNLSALLNEIIDKIGARPYIGKNAKHERFLSITNRLNEIGEDGGSPIIILDEAENSTYTMLKSVKELYDAIIDQCSIVLIGTDQLVALMNKKINGQSIPQLRRRFKAGTRFITPFNKARDMQPFFDLYIPKEKDVQDLLIQLCDNYGELHDYLDPVLRYCDKKGIPLDEKTFRLYHKIPKR